MAWKYNDRMIRVGRSWTNDDGITHPTNWAIWSDEDKVAAGLIWEDEPAPFDNRFYWSAGVPKALEDVLQVDESGEPSINPLTGEQGVTYGLKTLAIRTCKEQAAGLLASTDWYITRKAETDTAVPDSVLTYRASVRTQSGVIEAAITACETLEAFMALYDTPVDENFMPTGNAPIFDWPEEG
jgi:hypothetical protein